MLLYLNLKLILHKIKINDKIQANIFNYCLLRITLNNNNKKKARKVERETVGKPLTALFLGP